MALSILAACGSDPAPPGVSLEADGGLNPGGDAPRVEADGAAIVPDTVDVGPPPEPGCGDGLCAPEENSCTCVDDCEVETCGNGICCAASDEDAQTCAADCGAGCGDGACTQGESTCSCPQDCGDDPCGNAVCCYEQGESSDSCSTDCGTLCNDGICNGGENGCSCPGDCAQELCGNGVCCPSTGENGLTCPTDCPTHCGDGTCEIGEAAFSCCADCGQCCVSSDCADEPCGPSETPLCVLGTCGCFPNPQPD